MTTQQLALPLDSLDTLTAEPPRPSALRVWCPLHRWPASCGLCAQWERWRMSRSTVWYGYLSSDQQRVTTWPGTVLGRVTSNKLGQRRWSRQGYYRLRYLEITAWDHSLWWGRGSADQDLVVLHRCRSRKLGSAKLSPAERSLAWRSIA